MSNMAWLASFLILVSIGGCFCNDDDEPDCFIKKLEDQCDQHKLPATFPQTGEELLASCGAVKTKISCILEVKESCVDGPDKFINHLRGVLEYMEETCQEDNPTYKVIANNLPCVERVIRSRPRSRYGPCAGYFSEKNLEEILAHIKPFFEDESKEDLADCLSDLMNVACEGISFGYYCGGEVKDAVEEIEAHVHSRNSLECTPEQLEEVSPVMGVFEGLLLEDLALQNALERKRR